MINWIKTNIQGDKYIWVIAIVLSVIGLLSVYSATSLLAFQQKEEILSFFTQTLSINIFQFYRNVVCS